jgi:hypothetical protein
MSTTYGIKTMKDLMGREFFKAPVGELELEL